MKGTSALTKQSLAAIAAIAIAAVAAAHARIADPFYADFNPTWRTAYHSRSRIVEERPLMTTLLRAGFDSKEYGNFGKIGFWNFTVSSLTGRRDEVHRRPLNEMDYGCYWTYTWDFAQYSEDWRGWSLTTDVIKDWITSPGSSAAQRAKKSNASLNEWRIEQSLNTPYITPYYLLRRGTHPYDWLYVRVGARHKFNITEAIAFTPKFFAENGDEELFERRYGKNPGGGRYRTGIMTLNIALELSWEISEMATAYAEVQQFGIVNEDAREATKAGTSHRDRRDLTIGTIGLRFRF